MCVILGLPGTECMRPFTTVTLTSDPVSTGVREPLVAVQTGGVFFSVLTYWLIYDFFPSFTFLLSSFAAADFPFLGRCSFLSVAIKLETFLCCHFLFCGFSCLSEFQLFLVRSTGQNNRMTHCPPSLHTDAWPVAVRHRHKI